MNFEALTLRALLDNKMELLTDLRADMFTKSNIKLYELIIEYFDTNKKLPTVTEIKAVIDNRAPQAVKPQFLAIVDHIQELSGNDTDPDILIRELQDAATLRTVDSEITSLVEFQRDRNSTEVRKILAKLSEKINLRGVVTKDLSDGANLVEDHSVCRSFLTAKEETSILGGGHAGLTVYSATSGGGKSVALLQAGLNNYKDGKNVLFISLELGTKMVYNRLLSMEAEIDFTSINSNSLTPEESAKVKDAHNTLFAKENTNTFQIIDESMTDLELVNVIAVNYQVHGTTVFILDYIQLIESAGYGDDWKMLSRLAKKLHKLTKEYPITIITASQINEVSKSKEGSVVPEITARGSKELVFSATQFLHFDKSTEGVITMFSIKNRLAQPRHLILDPQFKYMRFRSTGIVIGE